MPAAAYHMSIGRRHFIINSRVFRAPSAGCFARSRAKIPKSRPPARVFWHFLGSIMSNARSRQLLSYSASRTRFRHWRRKARRKGTSMALAASFSRSHASAAIADFLPITLKREVQPVVHNGNVEKHDRNHLLPKSTRICSSDRMPCSDMHRAGTRALAVFFILARVGSH